MNLFNRALVFATTAHASVDHRRKWTGEPYIVHPIEVAKILADNGVDDEEMLAAALCHDVLEDTPVGAEDMLAADFPLPFIHLVVELTTPEYLGNRAERSAKEKTRLATISARAQTIKCADLISNTRSIVEHDRAFATVYLPEKAAALDVLTKADAGMHRLAAWHLMHAYEEMGWAVPIGP